MSADDKEKVIIPDNGFEKETWVPPKTPANIEPAVLPNPKLGDPVIPSNSEPVEPVAPPNPEPVEPVVPSNPPPKTSNGGAE